MKIFGFNIDLNPMDSPVTQAIVAHASTLGLGAILTNPGILSSFIPAAYQPLAIAAGALLSGWLATTAHNTAMNSTPPADAPTASVQAPAPVPISSSIDAIGAALLPLLIQGIQSTPAPTPSANPTAKPGAGA